MSGYYFLGKNSEDYQGGTGGRRVVEGLPEGSTENEFAPRRVSEVGRHRSTGSRVTGNTPEEQAGFFERIFGQKKNTRAANGEVGTLVKLRKAPVKIEPKVFFANERTFLAWMHLSVVLAGASIAILAFAEETNPLSQVYGVALLPVAISFIVYSMYQYQRRARMIRHRHPGPYEDTTGPVVLGVMLMISIVAQFALKLYSMVNY